MLDCLHICTGALRTLLGLHKLMPYLPYLTQTITACPPDASVALSPENGFQREFLRNGKEEEGHQCMF